MKLSRRSWLVAVLSLALVAPLTHLFAQSGAGVKRPLDIEDVIAFRALGATALSPNGQWLAYRMSPTQGDSEVILKNIQNDKEIKLAVGEGAGGAMSFSDDSQWLAVSTAATKAAADAARRASRPAAQGGMTLVELATGKKTDIAKIRRFAFNGEAGGWVALHRFARTRQRVLLVPPVLRQVVRAARRAVAAQAAAERPAIRVRKARISCCTI